jgi:hypothetical protein
MMIKQLAQVFCFGMNHSSDHRPSGRSDREMCPLSLLNMAILMISSRTASIKSLLSPHLTMHDFVE